VVVPTGIFAATSDWGSREWTKRLVARIERATGELVRLVEHTPAAPPKDPYADPTPFEDLLFGPQG
jgi:FMN reductase